MKKNSYMPIYVLTLLLVAAFCWPEQSQDINLLAKLQPPSLSYWFGTDWLGRDQFSRTLVALGNSLKIGGSAALLSACLALILATIASCHATLAWLVDLLIDTIMSLPHLLLLILLSLAVGGSGQGVIFAITLSHWPKLTRLLRSEMHNLAQQPYILLAKNFTKPYWQLLLQHMLPHILPQWLTGLLLLIPHAIMHAAALTFLGFGLDPNQSSMGILLSEASPYLLIGSWWLALFPGLVLVITLLLIAESAARIASRLRTSRGANAYR